MTTNATPVVDFPGSFRIHMGLAVSDLERSKDFYQTLFGQPPIKERPGYAKFEPADPSVNLSLNEARFEEGARRLPAHFGIQVKTSQAVTDAVERFRAAGLAPRTEEQTACCYAVQDKAWVQDPDGNEWEVFVVTDADSPLRKDEDSSCCEATGASCC